MVQGRNFKVLLKETPHDCGVSYVVQAKVFKIVTILLALHLNLASLAGLSSLCPQR